MNPEKQNNKKDIILFKKVSIVDKYNFYEYMSVMIDWWIWVSEALESAKDKVWSLYFKEKIGELITFISSWDSFSKAMKKMPNIFPQSETSIIESWETIGQLSSSLMKLSESLRKLHDLKNKIIWALTYPIIIMCFFVLALAIVLIYVVPAITPIFADSNVELPSSTKALLMTSDFVRNNFLLIILFCFGAFVWLQAYKNTATWRLAIERFAFSFPLVGKVKRNYILANVANNLSNLVWSWINIVKSLTLVSKATNSLIYQTIMEDVIAKVSKWQSIVSSIEEVDKDREYFTRDFLQMLSVWEKTANLEKVCDKMHIQYQKEVDFSLSKMTKWIEPIALLIWAVFVMWFASAIFMAITKVSSTVT